MTSLNILFQKIEKEGAFTNLFMIPVLRYQKYTDIRKREKKKKKKPYRLMSLGFTEATIFHKQDRIQYCMKKIIYYKQYASLRLYHIKTSIKETCTFSQDKETGNTFTHQPQSNRKLHKILQVLRKESRTVLVHWEAVSRQRRSTTRVS